MTDQDLKERLEALLEAEVLWFHRAADGLKHPRQWTINLMSLNGLLLFGMNAIAFYLVYGVISGKMGWVEMLFLLTILIGLIGGSLRHLVQDMRELRLIYGYTREGIFYVENIRERRYFQIPFADIHKMTRVTYSNGIPATVFFHTRVPVPFQTVDTTRGEERPMPTFEHFPEDKAIYDQLHRTWQAATRELF